MSNSRASGSVVKPMSYKALFAIVAALDLEIEQMDVTTAFLYGAARRIFCRTTAADEFVSLIKHSTASSNLLEYGTRISTFLCEAGFTPLTLITQYSLKTPHILRFTTTISCW